MTPLRKLAIIISVENAAGSRDLITLLTDFGIEDNYVGQMKGVLYSVNPAVRIVDLTHSILPGDIFGAAFVLKTSYRAFPSGTIHLVVVDPGVGSQRRPIIAVSPEYLFVGPDNGVFSYVYADNQVEVLEITNRGYFRERVSYTFHGRDIFAPICAHLSLGVKAEALGNPIERPVTIPLPEPQVHEDRVRGEVVHIDSFGNLITNIPKVALAGFSNAKDIFVEIGGLSIQGLSKAYLEKKGGEVLAIWGSSGLLEISLPGARADEFLKVGRGEPVVVRRRI